MQTDSKKHENPTDANNVLCAVKNYEIIPLKRFEKTQLELDLDKEFGYEERTIYKDIEQTYYDAIYKFGHTNIKIKTNLIPPQKYKFAAEEVEIVW